MEAKKTTENLIDETLNDPCASFWLKGAIRALVMRDPVDAAADAEYLYTLMAKRCADVLGNYGRLGVLVLFISARLVLSLPWCQEIPLYEAGSKSAPMEVR